MTSKPTGPLVGRVDAIFFDCDGVLLDSVHVKEEQFRAMIQERLPQFVDAAMDYYWRNGGTSRLAKFRWIWQNLAKAPLQEGEVEALGREFSERVFAGVVACPPLPGAMKFLEKYSAAFPLFLISGTPTPELLAVIEARKMSRYFREVVGSPQTKTEIGRRLLDQYSLEPKRVWFVGDATTDMEAARHLGVHFVGIDGPHLSPFLQGQERLIADINSLEHSILLTAA